MKSNIIIVLSLFLSIFFMDSAFAVDELHGYMTNHQDRTYNVTVTNRNGDEFNGTGFYNEEGKFEVTVHDQRGYTYSGIAVKNALGDYDLRLNNDTEGGWATGTMFERY